MPTDRTNIVSSCMMVKGAIIAETYAVLAAWNFSQSKKRNLDRLRRNNFIGVSSHTWLRDVAKVLNRRFEPAGRDRALVALAMSSCDIEEWKPLLLWHMTRDEFLLQDFLCHWLFSTCYDSSSYQVRLQDIHLYLVNIGKRGGITECVWTKATLDRVARALLRIATEFGLLKGRTIKEFTTYHLPERSFIYLLHIIFAKYGNPAKVINAPEWRMFLLRPADVDRELLRLHESKKIEYVVGSNFAKLVLPFKSAEDYAEKMRELLPGDYCDVDFANERIDWINPKTGAIHQAHVFIGVLRFSGMVFASACHGENGSSWVQANQKMYKTFGGVPRVTVLEGLQRESTKSSGNGFHIYSKFTEVASHQMTSVISIKQRSVKERAFVLDAASKIMRNFQFAHRRHTFTSTVEINHALAGIVNRINHKVHARTKTSRFDRWVTLERQALQPLPATDDDMVDWPQQIVHADGTVGLNWAYYSVPHQHRGKKARIKITNTHVEIFVDLERVAYHMRDRTKQGTRHVIPGHWPDNVMAYLEPAPQKVLSQARFISKSLHGLIEDLFAKDTLGHLRLAQRLTNRARAEIKIRGHEIAEPRINEAVEQMREFSNFRLRHFEMILQQLRQQPMNSDQTEKVIEQCRTAISAL